MHITLTQQHVVMALQLDLAPVLRFKEHPVTDIHGAHVRANAHDPCPGKASANLCRCRDHDATTGAPLTVFGALPNQHAVMEQPDRH